MEANFVKKIGEFTPEFLDGISKVFSANATLHIKVEYGEAEAETKTEETPAVAKRGPKPKAAAQVAAPKKRGRKAGFKKAAPVETPMEPMSAEPTPPTDEPAPKKRGRQPGFKPKPKAETTGDAPKKRGPKPKVPVEA